MDLKSETVDMFVEIVSKVSTGMTRMRSVMNVQLRDVSIAVMRQLVKFVHQDTW